MTNSNTKKIAELNDRLRKNLLLPDARNTFLLTEGFTSLEPEAQLKIIEMVKNFNNFSEENDPYKEHDFGSIEHKGKKIFWKIDYYDNDLRYGSENPADEKITRRVLTIMLASEY